MSTEKKTRKNSKKSINIVDYNIKQDSVSGVFGTIDSIASEGISGWLLDASKPTSQLEVKIYINTISVACGFTSAYRPDISAIMGVTVNCGFFVDWQKKELAKAIINLDENQLCPITILIGSQIVNISSSVTPSVYDIRKILHSDVDGYLDQVDHNLVVSGWAISGDQNKTACVQIAINGVIAIEKEANLPRPDFILSSPDKSMSGFKIQIPEKNIKTLTCEVEAIVNGIALPGSPIELDFSKETSIIISGIKNEELIIHITGSICDVVSAVLLVDGKALDVLEFEKKQTENILECAWKIPSYLIDGRPHVYVVAIQDKKVLIRSNPTILACPHYEFYLDCLNANKISGWVFRSDSEKILKLSLMQDGKNIADTTTNINRLDVINNRGLCRHPYVGFEFYLNKIEFNNETEFDLVDIEMNMAIARISTINHYELLRELIYKNVINKSLLSKLILESSGQELSSIKLLPNLNCVKKENKISIIIPIYGGAVETFECLESVFKAINNKLNQIIIINDCTPDPLIQDYLLSLESRSDLELIIIHKTINSGFSDSVNMGMIIAGNQDVILLNSDTVVQNGWIDRLVAVAELDDRIGTITPMSNNAEICTAPYLCKSLPINDLSLAISVDRAAATVNSGKIIDIPVAVGFCMYIRRECIDDIGLFDAATWGRGYGEEVDFCLKASANGWRHVMACDTFVVHRGNVSFGNEKLERIKESAAKISERYPFYNRVIERFIVADPVAKNRRAINIELINQALPQKRILHITHSFGGGTEQYVKDMITLNIEDGYTPMVLRFKDTRTSQLDIDLENTILSGFFVDNHNETYTENEVESLKENIIKLNFDRLHIHAPFGMSIELLNWFTSNYKYNVTIHDYAWICPRVTLTVAAGKYCGEPSVEQCNQCVRFYKSHVGLKKLLDDVDGNVLEYKENLKPIIADADTIFAGVNDVKQRMEKHGMTGNYKVMPHPITKNSIFSKSFNNVVNPSIENGVIKVALFGALSDIKGFHVLIECAENALRRNLPLYFIVFGYTMNDELCSSFSNIQVLGKYEEDELEEWVKKIKPHVSFFPSQWPETFSYTLSHSLRLGIYPVVSDIGAQSERVKELGFGTVYDISMTASEICLVLIDQVVASK